MRKPSKLIILIATILSFIAAFALVVVPMYIGQAVDLMIGVNNVDLTQVKSILITCLWFYLVYFFLNWLIAYISNEYAIKFVYEIRNKLEFNLMRNPLAYLDTNSHGKLLNLFTIDGELLIDGIYQGLTQLLNGVFVILISLYFMLQLSIGMTILVILMVPIMYYTSKTLAKKSQRLFRKQQVLAGQLSSHVKEAMENHELILNANYANQSAKDFEVIHAEYNIVGEKVQILGALVNPTVRVINNLNYALLGLLGAYYAYNYGLSVGSLMAFISYSILFTKPFNEFSAIISQIVAAKASYERMQAALSVEVDLDPGKEVAIKESSIVFEAVNFEYVKDKPIIKDLNLTIQPLSKVAIVGPTGAGKSTLINILMRYYDINSGKILIDGHDTQTITKQSLRSVMSIVLQEPWLTKGSIADNIKYGNPKATYEEMVTASKQAGCYDFIMQLDKQFDTIIDSASTTMSTGQKQMITIARAIIVNSPIIILDEATSNIDVVSEYKIQKAFEELMSNKTSFFVAHHLSTVVDADLILVMKDGYLIEQGSHKELMANKGFYKQLYESSNVL